MEAADFAAGLLKRLRERIKAEEEIILLGRISTFDQYSRQAGIVTALRSAEGMIVEMLKASKDEDQ